MATGICVGTYSDLAGVALSGGLLGTENNSEAEFHHLLEVLNCYKMEIERLKMLILEKDDAVKAMSTYLLNMKKKGATIETENVLLA